MEIEKLQECADAFRAGAKALERESILDKIRAEIEGYKSTIDYAIAEDEFKIEGMKEAYTDCLKIINEYREGTDDGIN